MSETTLRRVRMDSAEALCNISDERIRQVEKWGTQRHSWPEWMSILTEEVGEACQVANKVHWNTTHHLPTVAHLREELVQIAAVAVQIIEHIDEMEATHD